MFDISKVSVVCFDFDETLCIWKNINRGKGWSDERDSCVAEGVNYYEKHPELYEKSIFMSLFISEFCKGKTLCLTSSCKPNAFQIKLDWVERMYTHDFRMHCVERVDSKIKMFESICYEYGVSSENMLVVDDNFKEVLEPACKHGGFQVATPQDICIFVWENYLMGSGKY